MDDVTKPADPGLDGLDNRERDHAAYEQAARTLAATFERARASGYRPGSPQMQALDRAETAFQHAHRRWRAHDTQSLQAALGAG